MSRNHLPRQDLSLYVIGALEPAETARLEAHVAACPSCAAALADEARLEMKLQAVMPEALRERPPSLGAARSLPVVAESPATRRRWPVAMMLAASLVVVARLALQHVAPPRAPSSDADEAAQPEPSGLSGLSAMSLMSAMSAMSAAPAFSEWSSEAGPQLCRLPGGALPALLGEPPRSEPPALLSEAAWTAEANGFSCETGEGFTPVNAACYAPR
jgi:hypothetical protein